MGTFCITGSNKHEYKNSVSVIVWHIQGFRMAIRERLRTHKVLTKTSAFTVFIISSP